MSLIFWKAIKTRDRDAKISLVGNTNVFVKCKLFDSKCIADKEERKNCTHFFFPNAGAMIISANQLQTKREKHAQKQRYLSRTI